jgi:hypothetical protein
VTNLRDAMNRLTATLNNSSRGTEPNSPLGYAASVRNQNDAQRAVRSAEFFSDISSYYQERDGVTFGSHEEAVDYFMSDRRWRNMNTISLGRDMIDARSSSDEQSTRLARLQTVFDQMPNFYEEGGSGVAGLAENVGAALLDPINLIGFGAGGAAAKGAVATARAGGTQLTRREATRIGLRAGARQGAISEGVVGAGTSALFDAGTQMRNVDLGIQDEFSTGQLAASTAIGGVLGGALGAGFGAAGAVAPNPMRRTSRGFLGAEGGRTMNAVQEGLLQGAQSARATAREARAADAELGGQAATRTATQGGSLSTETETLDHIDALIRNLEDPEVETSAVATRVDQEFPETALPAPGTDASATPAPGLSSSQRLTRMRRAFDLARSQEQMFRQRATSISTGEMNVGGGQDAARSVSRVQESALTYENAANQSAMLADRLLQSFRRIDSDDVADDSITIDSSVDAVVEQINRAQTVDLENPVAVRGLLTFDPDAPARTGQLPDGSPMRDLTPEETETNRRRQAAIMPSVRGQGFSGAPEQVVPEGDQVAAATTPAEPEIDPRDSIGNLRREADEVDVEITGLDTQIRSLRNRATRQRNQGNEEVAVQLSGEAAELDARRAELRQTADAKRQEAEQVEQRYRARYAQPEATPAPTEQATEQVQPTAQGAQSVEVSTEVEAMPEPAPDFEQVLGRALNEADALAAGEGASLLDQQVDLLARFGFDPEEVRVAFKSLGRGNTRSGREARAQFMRGAIRTAIMDAFVSDEINSVAATSPDMVFHIDRMMASIETFPEILREEATESYLRFVRENILDGLVVQRLENNGYDLPGAIEDITASYGEIAGSIVADIFGASDDDFVQFAGLPNRTIEDILAQLPDEMRQSFGALREQFLRALIEGGSMSPAKAEEMARRLAVESLERKARDAGRQFTPNNKVIDGGIERIKNAQRDLRVARQELVGTFAKERSRPGTVTRSVKVRRDEVTGERMQFDQYLFEAGEGPTEAEAIASNAAAKKAEIYAAHSIPKETPIGTAIEMLEKRLSRLENQRGRTQTAPVNLQTRTSRDISVADSQGGNATFMGRSQRPGLGTYTQYGRQVEGGAPSAIQAMLRKVKSTGYAGRLLQRRAIRGENGELVRQSAIVSAALELAEAQRLKESAARMTADPIKRQRAVDEAAADETGRAFDVEAAEAARDAIQKADRALKSAEKKGGNVDQARARLEDAVAQARQNGIITPNEIEAEGGNAVAAIRRKLEPYTRSTGQEAAANREEVLRQDMTRQTLIMEANARASRIQGRMATLLKGRRPEQLTGAEQQRFFDLRDELAGTTRLLASGNRGERAAERAMTRPMRETLREERAARRSALTESVINQRMSDGDISVYSAEELSYYFGSQVSPEEYAEDLAAATARADQEMRLAAVEQSGNREINRAALEGMTRADLIAMVTELKSKMSRIESGSQAPASAPQSAKLKPYIRKVDGIEVDVNNDFTYMKGSTGTSVRFDGAELGVIRRRDDSTFTFEKVADASPNVARDIRLFENPDQVRDFIAREYVGRIKEAQARTQRFDETPGEDGFEYTVPWTESETYAGEASRPFTAEAPAADPITDPQVRGRDGDILSYTEDNFDIPPGKKLAVQFIDANQKTFGKVRVPIGKQTLGDTLKASASHQYVVGYVDAPYKSGSVGAQKTFRPLNPDDVMVPFNSRAPVRGGDYEALPARARNATTSTSPRGRVNRPAKIDSLAQKPLANATEFRNPVPAGYGRRMADLKTVADLYNYSLRLDNIAWDSIPTANDFVAFMAHRADVAEALQRYVPNGIEKRNQTLRQAESQIREIFAGRADNEIEAAISFLGRVAGFDNRRVPQFATATGRPAYAPNAARRADGSYPGETLNDENVGRIIVGDDMLDPVDASGKRWMPATATLVHETGHWIYQNLLDESDKAAFWQAMLKYYDQTGVDMAALKRGSGNVLDNELRSPAEFFANQFMAYVMKTGQVDMTLWQKIAKMATTLIRRIIRGEEDFEIDADLIPIFQRHMPALDIDPETGLANGGVSRFAHLPEFGRLHGKPAQGQNATMNQAEFKGRQLVQLDELRVKALSALNLGTTRGDSLQLATALDEVGRKVFGLYGGKKGKARHKVVEGAEDRTGFSRIYSSDDSQSARELVRAQRALYDFVKELRDRGFDANRNAAANRGGSAFAKSLSSDDAGALYKVMEDQTSTLDADFFSADIEAASSLRNAGLEGLEAEAVNHLRRLGRNMVYALDRDIRSKLAEFNRSLPRTAKGAGVMISATGSAYMSPGNFRSQFYMRAAKAAGDAEVAQIEAAIELVNRLNTAGLRDLVDDQVISQVAQVAARSAKRMTDEEIVSEVAASPDVSRRAVELANELRERQNARADLSPVMDNLTDEQQRIVSFMQQSRENAQLTLSNAIETGNPRLIQIATHVMREMGVDNPAPITNPSVTRAIEASARLSEGTPDEDGLPASFPSGLRDYANLITHRDARTQEALSKVFVNMMTHLKSPEELAGNASAKFTEYDAAVILGRVADDADDEAPLRTDNALYNDVRKKMRRIGQLLAKGERDEVVDEVSSFAYGLLAPSERKVFESTAASFGDSNPREFFNTMIRRSLAGRMTRDEVERLRSGQAMLRLIGSSRERVVSILSGLRRTDADDDLVMFAAYGDVFASLRSRTPMANAAYAAGRESIHPTIAGRAAREIVDTLDADTDLAARRFLGVSSEADLNSHVHHVATSRGEVRGITPTENGRHGTGIYLKRNADEGYDDAAYRAELERSVADLAPNAQVAEAGVFAARQVVSLRERLLRAMSGGASASDVAPILQAIRVNWSVLKSISPRIQTRNVLPVFARIRAPFDFSTSVTYSTLPGKHNIDHLMTRMVDDGLITPRGLDALRNSLPQSFNGAQLYDALTGDAGGVMHRQGDSIDGINARDRLNEYLRDIGYDSLKVDEGMVAFNVTAVRELRDGFSDMDMAATRPELYTGKTSANVLEIMSSTGDVVDNGSAVGITVELQEAGVSETLIKPIRRIMRGRNIEPEDVDRVAKTSTVLSHFWENSQRLRAMGANWFADRLKPENGTGFFEAVAVQMSNSLTPIFDSLRELPDNGNRLGRWMRGNDPRLKRAQPGSHRRILDALRRGRAEVARLKPEERVIAARIAREFEAELARVRESGIPIGDTRRLGNDFHVPQVWDIEQIRDNPSIFVDGMARFFAREQNTPGFTGTRETMDVLRNRAKEMMTRMLSDEEGHIDGAEYAKPALGDPFHRRVLSLQPGDFDALDAFLVNDLEALLVKYFDRTVRARMLADRFGVQGHGFEAYKTVAQHGREAARDILLRDKAVKSQSMTRSGMIEVEGVAVPRLTSPQPMVDKALREVEGLLSGPDTDRIAKKDRARNILLNLQSQDFRNDRQFQVRVDAIINAMVDFPRGQPASKAVREMDNMSRTMNRRPIDGSDGTSMSHQVTRRLRAFNSITLLAFTTLTSIPDVTLPLVRSGNVRAFGTAWKRYASDPDYRRAARNMGVSIENIVHNRMAEIGEMGSQRLTNAFFNLTLLEPWTKLQREVAAMVGYEAMRSEISRAVRLRQQGRTNSNAYRTSVRFLERYGLTGVGANYDFLAPGAQVFDLAHLGGSSKEAAQLAAMRFTNEAIFSPNPNDIPQWAQTPWGATVFQLKSFPLMMQRLVGSILKEARQGNLAPLASFATVGVGMGMVSAGVKDVIQQRGGEDQRSAATRERALSSQFPGLAAALGIEEGEATDEVIGWYLEGLLAVGGLGLIADFFYNSAEQADNGAYGHVRMLSFLGGPSVSIITSGYDVAAGVSDAAFGEAENTGKERQAARAVIGRVPILGGIRDVREGVADLMGEPNTGGGGGGRSSGFGSSGGFSSGGFGSDGFGS